MFLELTDDERNHMIKTCALGLARERYRRDNPGCASSEAWAWAGRYWRDWVPAAIDFIAISMVMEQDEAVAPYN